MTLPMGDLGRRWAKWAREVDRAALPDRWPEPGTEYDPPSPAPEPPKEGKDEGPPERPL